MLIINLSSIYQKIISNHSSNNMLDTSKPPRTHIQLPLLTQSTFITAYAQQRPFREGGNRLETQIVNDKLIVHNYGHGGAGISLAPGSAIEAVNLASSHLQGKSKDVAIIGCGVVGLMNCRQFLKRYPQSNITIYAERIPEFGQKNNDKMITSQVAPGFWLPYHYGSNNPQLHARLSTLSLQQFISISKEQPYRNILNHVDVLDISDQKFSRDYFNVLTEELKPTFREYRITLNNKTTVQCREFAALKIDMQPFLQTLMTELKKKGVQFVSKKIDAKILAQLPEKIIFNCSGLGNRELFNDSKMKGIKGHLLEFKNENPSKFDYILKANDGDQIVTYYMHHSRIMLGQTREAVDDCKVDEKMSVKLLESHRKVLEKFGIITPRPKL